MPFCFITTMKNKAMKLDDILAKFVTLATIVFVGWYVYAAFKNADTSEQQSVQDECKYDINEYRKQQEEEKKLAEEKLKIAMDYLKRYNYNVIKAFTTNPTLNNYHYNVRGTILNPDGTTCDFGIMVEGKTVTRCDIE